MLWFMTEFCLSWTISLPLQGFHEVSIGVVVR